MKYSEIKLSVYAGEKIGDFILTGDRIPKKFSLIDEHGDMLVCKVVECYPLLTENWLRAGKSCLRRESEVAQRVLEKWGRKKINKDYEKCPTCKQDIY